MNAPQQKVLCVSAWEAYTVPVGWRVVMIAAGHPYQPPSGSRGQNAPTMIIVIEQRPDLLGEVSDG